MDDANQLPQRSPAEDAADQRWRSWLGAVVVSALVLATAWFIVSIPIALLAGRNPFQMETVAMLAISWAVVPWRYVVMHLKRNKK